MMLDLETFFKEKDIPYSLFEIEYNGQIHLIDTDTVIKAILSTTGNERTQIAGMLFKLDFHNASILNYLQHLAICLVQERFSEE